jgi:hypothetical protein
VETIHYVYIIGVGIVVIVVAIFIIVLLWTHNAFKATIGAVTGGLVAFLVGMKVPDVEGTVTSNGENIIPGVNIQIEDIRITGNPPELVMFVVGSAVLVLLGFGCYLYLDNKDDRRHRPP